jgi:hypothetical protein
MTSKRRHESLPITIASASPDAPDGEARSSAFRPDRKVRQVVEPSAADRLSTLMQPSRRRESVRAMRAAGRTVVGYLKNNSTKWTLTLNPRASRKLRVV